MPDNTDAAAIEKLRPPKTAVNPEEPYLQLHEPEAAGDGTVRAVNTIFLTNSECPFRCLMCDLWKHTLDRPTPDGAIPRQIEYALARLPEADVIKLYNNGNFFDRRAIPPSDHETIAALLTGYERVIVENHPKLCGDICVDFANRLEGSLEIAMGLETIHPEVLPRLNKQITTENYRRAARFLKNNGIGIRTFLLLNPPYLTDTAESIEWTVRSADFAFEQGSDACAVIPTRPGNGIMDKLRDEGAYVPPTLEALEEAVDRCMALGKGRIFADLWDLEAFAGCDHCVDARQNRLHQMNLRQQILPRINCEHH